MASSNNKKVAGDLKAGKVNFDWLKKNNMDIADLVKMARKNKPGYVEDDDSDGSYYEEIIEEEVIEDDLSLLKRPSAVPGFKPRGSFVSMPKPAPTPAAAPVVIVKHIPF